MQQITESRDDSRPNICLETKGTYQSNSGFCQIEHLLWNYSEQIGSYGIAVYVCLMRHANNRVSFVSYETIARECKMSRRLAIQTVSTLIRIGIVQTDRSKGRHCNVYNLPLLSSLPTPTVHEDNSSTVQESNRSTVYQHNRSRKQCRKVTVTVQQDNRSDHPTVQQVHPNSAAGAPELEVLNKNKDRSLPEGFRDLDTKFCTGGCGGTENDSDTNQNQRQEPLQDQQEDDCFSLSELTTTTEVTTKRAVNQCSAAGEQKNPSTPRQRTKLPITTPPQEFTPDATTMKWLQERRLTDEAIKMLIETVVDSWKSSGRCYADWQATFRNWAKKEMEFNPDRYKDHRPRQVIVPELKRHENVTLPPGIVERAERGRQRRLQGLQGRMW